MTDLAAGGGDLVHGAAFTVTGSGFGSKAGHDLTWDDCSHGDPITDRWDGYWPSAAASAFNMDYRTPAALGRGVSTPHSNVTAYLCGCHRAIGSNLGQNVAIWKNYTRTLLHYSYWHWYERIDPNWSYGIGDPNDGNYKIYGYSVGGSIYELPDCWYLAADASSNYPTADTCLADFCNASQTSHAVIGNDDSVPAGTGMSYYGYPGSNPPVGGVLGYSFPSPQQNWVRRELLIRWDNAAGGTGDIRFWTNNTAGVLDVAGGHTDGLPGTARSEGIGGYARDYGATTNYRYYSDVLCDRGPNPGRFYATNHATYASATIREPQPWITFSDTSCSLLCNKGQLSSGTVHIHYRNELTGAHQYLGTRTMS